MNSMKQKWIQIGIAFSSDSEAKVICPNCEKGKLNSFDVESNSNPKKFERHIVCNICGGQIQILMERD